MADKMLKSAARSVCKYSRTSPYAIHRIHAMVTISARNSSTPEVP